MAPSQLAYTFLDSRRYRAKEQLHKEMALDTGGVAQKIGLRLRLSTPLMPASKRKRAHRLVLPRMGETAGKGSIQTGEGW